MQCIKDLFNLEYIEYALYENNVATIKSLNEKTKLNSSLYFELDKNLSVSFISKQKYGNLIKTCRYCLLVGVLTIEEKNFFIFVDKVKKTGNLKNHIIYEIESIDCVPFSKEEQSKMIKNKLDIVKAHFSKGFYFCYSLNLARFLEVSNSPFQEFVINYNLHSMFLTNEKNSEWAISIVNGFFKTYKINIRTLNFFISFFLKISKFNSNLLILDLFIESEKSFTKYRNILIDASTNEFETELLKILKNDSKFLFINGIDNKKKEKQIKVINSIEKLFDSFKNKMPNIKYQYIGDKEYFEESQEIKSIFESFNQISSFFQYSKYDKLMIEDNPQKGVFILFFYKHPDLTILNFLLDNNFEKVKTIIKDNVEFSLMFQQRNLQEFNQDFKIDLLAIFHKIYKNLFLFLTDSPNNNFSINYKKHEKFLFYNKDIFLRIMLNQQFTNQKLPNLLETQIITESMTKEFGLKMRHLEQNDKSTLNFNLLSKNFSESISPIKCLFITYKLNGVNIDNYILNINVIIDSIINKKPDLIYFGFQEIEDTNFSLNIIFKNQKKKDIWKHLLINELKDFQLMLNEGHENLYTFLFVLKSKTEKVTVVENNKINLGLLQLSKAAFSHVIKINQTFLQITNCELSKGKGEKNIQTKIFDIDHIISSDNKRYSYTKPDVKIFLGNFNSSINSHKHELIKYWKEDKNFYSKIIEFDEISRLRNSLPSFAEFEEEIINFGPTSKFDKETKFFVNDQKSVPSWTDRIFFYKGNENFKIFDYNSFDIFMSTHLPVFLLTELFC